MMRRALLGLLVLALPLHAEPLPDPHPFPWITGKALLQKLERPRKPSDPAEGALYMMGIEDATADREWCYSTTKPGTTQLQPALLDLIRSLPPAEAKRNAALLAIRAWKKVWPCTPECCHG
jgi:hypothetical protein